MGGGLRLSQKDRRCWLFWEMPGNEGKSWGGSPRGDVRIGDNEPSRTGGGGWGWGVSSLYSRSFGAVVNGG